MRQITPPTLFSWICATALEIPAFLCALALYPLGWSRRYQTTHQQGDGVPILLIHGYLHNASAWIYLRQRLKQARQGPIYTLNLGHPFQSLESYAQTVQRKADAIRRETNTADLILISHSMGGVVSALYAATLAPRNSVRKIITIGSPLQGTALARIAIGPAGRALIPGSQLLQKLHKAIAERPDLCFHHITSTTDSIVFPPQHTVFNNTNHHFTITGRGHFAILYTPAIADKLIHWLGSRGANLLTPPS